MEPFTLRPTFKDNLWGGSRLKTQWNKDTELKRLAESWELSGHPAGDSVVCDGPYAEMTLRNLASQHPEIVSRNHDSASPFPILVKLIDAALPLSVQVHPDDTFAARHQSFGKTEMWIILDHDPEAFIYLGFNQTVTKDELKHHIINGTLPQILHKIPVKCGDTFFISAGTVHAIGGGILLAEVQQSSDITYRMYDYDRRDSDGHPRELHIESALAVATGSPANASCPGAGLPRKETGCVITQLARCPFFAVQRVELSGRWHCSTDGSTFFSLLCLDGQGHLDCGSSSLQAVRGTSLFIPANAGTFQMEGQGTFLLSSLGGLL